MSFSVDITKFVKKTNGNADKVMRKIVFDLTRNIIKRTPVDTGRARAAWQVGRSLPTSGKGSQSTGWIHAGDVVYIANNVEYILALEYGHSTQAPHGMMRITALSFEKYLNSAVASLK